MLCLVGCASYDISDKYFSYCQFNFYENARYMKGFKIINDDEIRIYYNFGYHFGYDVTAVFYYTGSSSSYKTADFAHMVGIDKDGEKGWEEIWTVGKDNHLKRYK